MKQITKKINNSGKYLQCAPDAHHVRLRLEGTETQGRLSGESISESDIDYAGKGGANLEEVLVVDDVSDLHRELGGGGDRLALHLAPAVDDGEPESRKSNKRLASLNVSCSESVEKR